MIAKMNVVFENSLYSPGIDVTTIAIAGCYKKERRARFLGDYSQLRS